jgi:hypothetical protein
MKISKSHGTSEFKELAVTRVRAGHSARAVAMELRLIEQTLRNRARWLGQALSTVLEARWLFRSRWNYQDCEPRMRD